MIHMVLSMDYEGLCGAIPHTTSKLSIGNVNKNPFQFNAGGSRCLGIFV